MPTTTFLVHVYENVEPIDVGGTFGVLSMAKRVDPGINIELVAERAGAVRLASGLEILVAHSFARRPAADVLIILGGGGWPDQSKNAYTLDFIRTFAKSGLVASVCTGSLIVAGSGLLDGRSATTRRHAPRGVETPLALMEKLYPLVKSKEARFVDSGTIVTGGGVILAVDTTLHLIARFRGQQVAEETARIIEYPWSASGEFVTGGMRESQGRPATG